MTVIESIPFTKTRKEMDEAYKFYVLAVMIVASSEGISEVDVLERIAKTFFKLQKPINWSDVAGVEDKVWKDMWLTSSFNYAHSCYGRYGGIISILQEKGFEHCVDTKTKQKRLEKRVNKCIDGLSISPTFASPSPICNL